MAFGSDQGRRRVAHAWGTALITVILLALLAPLGLHVATALTPSPEPSRPPIPAAQLAPVLPAAVVPGLDPEAPLPDAGKLKATLDKALAGADFSATVLDGSTGRILYSKTPASARIPASNLKLLTAAAVLSTLDPDSRLTTEVLQTNASTLILRGGGDVLLGAGTSQPDKTLGHAGLGSLAEAAVSSLKKGTTPARVTVSLDASLFSGATLNPAVDVQDVQAGETAPVFPLALNSARDQPLGTGADRPQDSAQTVLKSFLLSLTKAASAAGVKTTFVAGPAASGASNAVVIANVESATLADQVSFMLSESDNYLTEVLARLVAIHQGKPGTYEAGRTAVLSAVEGLGFKSEGLVLADVAGLSLQNRISTDQLASIMELMANGRNAALSRALPGLPIAGLTGTLDARYQEGSSAAGAGLVRAKTGTLNTALALTGTVVNSGGRLLVFSFVGNNLDPAAAAANKAALDTAATTLATLS